MERNALRIGSNPSYSVGVSCQSLQYRFKSSGPHHAPVFEVRVFYPLLQKEYMAIGFSKQSAKQSVAKLIFEDLVTGVEAGQFSCINGIFKVASNPQRKSEKIQPQSYMYEVHHLPTSVVSASKALAFPGFISFNGPVAKRPKLEAIGGNQDLSEQQSVTASSITEICPLEEQSTVTEVEHVAGEPVNVPISSLDEPEHPTSSPIHDVDPHDPAASTWNENTHDTASEAENPAEACGSRPRNPNWFSVSDLEMWNPTDDPEEQYGSTDDHRYSYEHQNCSPNLIQVYPLCSAPTTTELIPRDREMMFIGPGKVPFVRKHFVAAEATKKSDDVPVYDVVEQCDPESQKPFNVNPLALKLVTKMGWSQGRGLGKSNQGRTEPVQVVARPSKEVNAGLGYGFNSSYSILLQ